jgi:hypothetical protein
MNPQKVAKVLLCTPEKNKEEIGKNRRKSHNPTLYQFQKSS